MGTILLKDILKESRLYAYSTKEILEKFLTFDDKTLVFFDTESTGIDPNKPYVQMTQLALMVVDGSTYKIKEEFSTKIDLLPQTIDVIEYDPTADNSNIKNKNLSAYHKDFQRHLVKYKKPDKTIKDILGMTQYYSGENKKMSETDALSEMEKILNRYKNVILIAHNAKFDIKLIQVRRRVGGMPPLKRYPVLDTLSLSRFFFIPTLEAIQHGDDQAKLFLDQLLAKTKYRSYTSSLGKLANVFKITADNWHDASADVTILFHLLQKMIEFLKAHSNVDISKYKGTQIKRFRKTTV